MQYSEQTLIDVATLEQITQFRNKNHTLKSIYAELNKLNKPEQIIRMVSSEEHTCCDCKKKAIYLRPDNNTYLCWMHGYKLLKP